MPGLLAVQRIATAALPAAQMAEVRRLCDEAYGTPTEPFFTSVGPGEHLLGFASGALITHLMWVTRWLQPGGVGPLRTAYVELVATRPGAQRHGYATALLEALPPLLGDHELAALCPATDHLYERLGWQFWRGPLFTRTADGLVPNPEERVMIFRLPRTPHLDLDASLSVEWRSGEVW